MTDSKHGEHHAPERAPIDSEIDVRRAVEVGLWLGGTTVGALVIGYFLYLGLSKWTAGDDPAPSALSESGRHVLPPAPNLQTQPEKELAAMRAAEHERLTTWGWTDQSLGLAHMPIDEAIARLAVPEPPAPPAAEVAPAEPVAAEAHAAAAAPASTHEGTH
jgi:hypothetical protein